MGFGFSEETRFKETEIGLIPEDWQVVRLGEVAEISSGGSAPQGDIYFGGKNFFIRVSHIENSDNSIKAADLITDEAVRKYKLRKYPKGTIVFPKSGATIYLEKRAQLPFDAYIVSHLCAVNSNRENPNQDFLFYVLLSTKFAEKKGDGYPTLNLSEIKQISIPLPPLSEQKAIAEVLRTIQEAKEKTEAVIKATKELKKSMMKHLFSYGVDGVYRVHRVDRVDGVNGVERVDGVGELKETEIGLIPKHWQVVRLGEVAEIKTSFLDFNTLEEINNLNEQGILVNYVKVSDMNLPINHLFINQTNISKIIKKNQSVLKRLLKPYSLIFPKRGGAIGTNKKRITRYYSVLDPNLLGISIVNNSLDIYFLYSYFELFVDLKSLQDNTPIPQLNKHNFENLPIPLPPLSEQQAIAEILQAIDEKIQKEEAKKQTIDNLFKTMLSNLMSGKLRVNRVREFIEFIELLEFGK